MRIFSTCSFLGSIVLLAGWTVSVTHGTKTTSLRGDRHQLSSSSSSSSSSSGSSRSLQGSPVIRTDLIRLIPFQVQIAIQDETSAGDSLVITETLYQGGTLLTDTITDWMITSFVTKTTNDQAEQILVNNYTSFDSIALELVDDSTSKGIIDGQELNLVQVSFEGVSLWEREGTGTPPMEQEIVELIQRATFLEDRNLQAALQTTVNNLLFDLGIDSVDGVQQISIVDVRAYITPPGSNTNGEGNQGQGSSSDGSGNQNSSFSRTNKNLEIIIIVAIVVACMAFALLVFAVIWAWRTDRHDRGDKPSSSKQQRKANNSNSNNNNNNNNNKPTNQPRSEPPLNGGERSDNPNTGNGRRPLGATQKRTSKGSAYQQAPEETEDSVEPKSLYDLPHTGSEGSYPKVIGNTTANGGTDDPAVDYPDDSVISEDISSSLTAYYKSGMGYNGNKNNSGGGRTSNNLNNNHQNNNFNDAASMSSMDSYGYSLDGYAPSLGPAPGGYPVGPMQVARDAAMPVDNDNDAEEIDIKQLQDDESVADYDSEPPPVSTMVEA